MWVMVASVKETLFTRETDSRKGIPEMGSGETNKKNDTQDRDRTHKSEGGPCGIASPLGGYLIEEPLGPP